MRNILILFIVAVFLLTLGTISQEANASTKSSNSYQTSQAPQQIDIAKWSEILRTNALVSDKYVETAMAPAGNRRKRRRR